jgi:hypothetical protein
LRERVRKLLEIKGLNDGDDLEEVEELQEVKEIQESA